MNGRRAYEQIEISLGGNVVVLRPTLRAATILEDRFGLQSLFQALNNLNLTIIHEIILASATSRQNAAAALSSLRGRPLLPFFLAVRQPLADLVSMFIPAPVSHVRYAPASTGKPLPWRDLYADLYSAATGWLGWTPEQTWNATPTEIDRAHRAHVEKLKAIHGGGADKEPDPEQVERNIAEGLDPEFDRDGLHALKGKGKAS